MTSFSCLSCSSSCLECSGPEPSQCLSCSSPKYLDSSYYCVNNCSSSQYRADDKSCQQCDTTCNTCSGPGPNNCTSCLPGNDLHGQQCVSIGCFTGCKTCADPSRSQCYTCLDGYSFLQVNGYLGQCLQQCPQLYFVTVASSTISLCHAKNLVTNRLMYGSSTTQVKIMMSGYLAYDYNVVVAGITISIGYAQGQPAIDYVYSFASAADNTYITLSFTFTGHLLPGSTLTLHFENFVDDNTTTYYLNHDHQTLTLGEAYTYSQAVQSVVNATAMMTTVYKSS